MIRIMLAQVQRDLVLAARQKAEILQPLMFFVLVISLFPLGIGPGPQTLQKVGPGIIWVAALLSALLGLERLFRDDSADGSLEQWLLLPTPLWLTVVAKVVAHWLVSILPLILISPLLSLFLNLTADMYWALLATLLIGTPVISFVGAIGVGLTVGIQRGGVLLSLLLLPILVPLLILATSAVDAASIQLSYSSQLLFLGAMLLVSAALAPIASAYALKVSLN